MIKIKDNESLQKALLDLQRFKSSVSVSNTWKHNKNDNFSIKDIREFYKNDSGKGLIERDSKIFPYFLDENVHGSLKMEYTFKGLVSLMFGILRHLKNYIYFPFLILFHFEKLPFQKNKLKEFYFYLFGKPFNGNINKYIDQLNWILNHKNNNAENILEVAGGYGGFCEIMFNNFDFDNYFLVDLAETLSVASFYLSHSLESEIFLLQELEDIKYVPRKGKNIILIPANLYNHINLQNYKIDFFINSNSFAEIGNIFVKGYLDFFKKWSTNKALFFSCNQISRKEIHDSEVSYYSLDWASDLLKGKILDRSIKNGSELGMIEF